jgi:hypothetical protein
MKYVAEKAEIANVVMLAHRLAETPDDQPGLLADRLNDLRVAIYELEVVLLGEELVAS